MTELGASQGAAAKRTDRLNAGVRRAASDRGPRLHLGRRAGPHAPRLRDQDRAGTRRGADRALSARRYGAAHACGRPGDRELVIPRPSGGPWTREDWANWRRRVWRPAAVEAGVTG